MEHLKCLSCGHLNPPSAAACEECGTALVAPSAAPVIEPATVPAAPETIVVQRPGMSQSAMLATFLLGLVALVVVGILMYQWGRTDSAEEDLARARAERNERADRDLRTTPTTSTTPTTTVPAPAPVVIPPPSAPPVTVTVPPSPSTLSPATSGAARPDPCATYVSKIDPLLEDWNQLLTTAGTQTGDDLAQTLDQMRDVQQQVSRVEPPACAGAVHGRLLTAMSALIEALRTGSPGGGFPTSTDAYRQAQELFDRFQTDYEALRVTHS